MSLDDDVDINWWINMREMITNIGDSGACSIGEGLKVNSTITDLYLGMRI